MLTGSTPQIVLAASSLTVSAVGQGHRGRDDAQVVPIWRERPNVTPPLQIPGRPKPMATPEAFSNWMLFTTGELGSTQLDHASQEQLPNKEIYTTKKGGQTSLDYTKPSYFQPRRLCEEYGQSHVKTRGENEPNAQDILGKSS